MLLKMSSIVFGCVLIGSRISFATSKEEKIVQGSLEIKNLIQTDYPAAAQINLRQAMGVAANKVPGHIISIALEEENGFLVYAVKIASTSSGAHEIFVDAGNGKILSDLKKVQNLESFNR